MEAITKGCTATVHATGVVKEMLGCYGHVMPQKSQVGKGTKPSLPGSLA